MERWAKVSTNAASTVRRGAWYKVLSISEDEAVIEVNHRPVVVSRSILEIASVEPSQWSIVPRPPDAIRIPGEWGAVYGVCPGCGERAPLGREASMMECPRCGGVYDIATG